MRAEALAHVSARLAERAEEIARLITAENGKPLLWARGEVARAVSTFRFAAEEARRFSATTQRLDTDPAAEGRMAYITRVPKGPVLGISPFNFPLNLAAHKIAPAIAAGAPIVLKPAPATPLSALLLGELLAETDLPAGMFSILPVPNDRAPALVDDPRLPIVSFTGSVPVGWAINDQAPRKHVTLELGGNGAAVVLPDADLDWAAQRVGLFANYQAGQSCIAVQRVYVDRSVYEEFVPKLVDTVASSSPATRGTTRPRSARSSARRPPSASSPGWTRPSRRARRSSRAAPARAPRTRPPSSPTSRRTPRSPARRSSGRSCSSSP